MTIKYYLSDEIQKRFKQTKKDNGTNNIICYKGKEIELPCVCASRGRNPENPSSRESGLPTEQRIELNTKGTSNTITTVQKDNYVLESHRIICEQRCDEGLRFFKNNICGTIRTIDAGGDKRVIEVEHNYRIRKLTPRECLRLMGVSDEDITKMQSVGLSDSSLYKLAGNSIVKNVLDALHQNLFLEVKMSTPSK